MYCATQSNALDEVVVPHCAPAAAGRTGMVHINPLHCSTLSFRCVWVQDTGVARRPLNSLGRLVVDMGVWIGSDGRIEIPMTYGRIKLVTSRVRRRARAASALRTAGPRSQAHTISTAQPPEVNARRFARSLLVLALNFSCQNSVRVDGVVAYRHRGCLCQKQP